ncbi:dystroglycan-related [Anaeramoeba flamelloides]|uniref:Dystroglycan-related n=1 Tax=Anaeramoeba flamelloides TaxID=1746091 RepID=A0ABQ8YXL6_9EUKA|nr:dystroglycan-related [Anaeramoeba flamelloides]
MNNKMYKIIIVGDSGVGKSSILVRYLHDEFQTDYDVTIGVEFGSLPLEIMDQTILLQIWDTAGQESFRSIIRPYYRRAVGALIVFDITQRESFNSLVSWLEDVRLNASNNVEITLIGNKADLSNDRAVSYEEGEKFAKEHGLEYYETSANTSKNIEKIFEEIAKSIFIKVQRGDIQIPLDIAKFCLEKEPESGSGSNVASKNEEEKKSVNSSCVPVLTSGPEVVSTVPDEIQSDPKVSSLQDGSWVIGWEDHRNEASIYGQRYSVEGSKLGDDGDSATTPNIDFLMSTTGDCDSSALASLVDGGWVVVYAKNQTKSRDIMYQRFSASGEVLISETLVNEDLENEHMSPDVTGLNNGGYAIVWTDFRNDDQNSDIYVQLYNSDDIKIGSNFLVNDQDVEETRRNAKITSHLNDAASSFTVFWEDWRLGYSKIFGQFMSGDDGTQDGDNFELTPDKLQAQFKFDVSILKDDGYVIVWQSFGQISQNDIWGIIVNSDKTYRFGSDPFEMETQEQREIQESPTVTGVFDGGFVIVWQDYREGTDPALYGMRFDDQQNQVGTEFQISESVFKQEENPTVTTFIDNELIMVAWQGSHSSDNSGIFQSIYNVSYSFPSVKNGLDDQIDRKVDSELNYQIPEDAFNCKGDAMTFEAKLMDGSDFPSWLSFNGEWENRTFMGIPTGCPVSYTINVTAGCCFDTINDQFTLNVINQAVSKGQSIPDQEVEINKYFDYYLPDDIFSNNEPDEQVYDLVKLTDGSDLPEWLEWLDNDKRFLGQAPIGCSFELEISIKRNDTCELNLPAEDIFKLQIVNNDPYLNSTIPNQSNLVGETLNFVIPEDTFTNDEEIEQLTYSASLSNGEPLPDWLNFDPNNKQFTGEAPLKCSFDLEIKVMVEDQCETNTPASTIFVWNFTNDPPVVNKEMDDQTFEIGEVIDFLIPDDIFNNSESNSDETLTVDSKLANGEPLPDWLNWDSDNKQYTGKGPLGCSLELLIDIVANDECETNAMAVTQFWLNITNDQVNLTNGMSDMQYEINFEFELSIPEDTFTNDDLYEEIDYQAQLSNEEPLPDWLHFDNETLLFSGTTPLGCPLDYNIKIKASDSCNYALDFFRFNVTNESPVQNKDLTNQNYQINNQFEYIFPQDTFTNKEQISEPLNYEAKLSNGDPLPDWLNFYSSERKFNGTTPLQCQEILDIQLVITDSCYTLTDEFQFEIINQDPILLNPLPPKSFRVGDQVNFTFSENTFLNNEDPNIEELNYEAKLTNGDALPDWLTFIANERRFVGEAPLGCKVVYEIIIDASDSCTSVNDTFQLTITNDEPQNENDKQDQYYEILTDFYINIGDSFSNDQDLNEELKFELIQQNGDPIPEWMNFYNESMDGDIFVDGTTPGGCQNSWDLKIIASDSCYTREDLFTFYTTNEKPYLNIPLEDQEFESGEPFEFIFPEESFINEDLYEELNYEAQLSNGDPLPSWMNFYSSERKFNGTTKEQCPEIFEIILMAEDTCYSLINDTFNFEIINNPPKLNANITIDDQQVYNGDYFEYIFPENLFINEESFETLTYTSQLSNGDPLPDWLTFDSNERKYHGNSPDGCAIDYEILLEATDSCLATNTSFMIAVLNESPILDGTIEDQSYQNNDQIDFVFPEDLFINNDLDETLTYNSQLSNGDPLPDWLTFLPDERRYTGTAPDICGIIVDIELTASDGCLSTSTFFQIQVGNNPPKLDNPIEDETILFDEDFTLSFPEDTFSTDNPNEELNYQATLSSDIPLPDWISFNSDNREFTGHSPDCKDLLEIKINCSDSCYSIYDTFKLEIQNDPPKLINAIDDQTFQHDTDITFIFDENTFQNNESSKQQFAYEAKLSNGDALPDWLTFVPNERKFSGHVPRGCGFELDIYLNASDNCNWDSDSFKFIINNYQIYQNNSIPDQYQFQVNEIIDIKLETNTFVNQDTDEDINYEVTLLNGDPLPSWIEFINDQDANEQKFVGQAPLDCSNSIDILINVSDSCSSIQDQFNIAIVNSKLTKNKDLVDQEYEVGETFEYIFDNVTWTNDDLYEEIDYQATLSSGEPLPDWLHFDPDARKFHGTAPLQCGDFWEINVIANDSCVGTELESNFIFKITNSPIIQNKGLVDQEFEVGETFEYIFDNDTFINPEIQNEEIIYEAKLSNGEPLPGWMNFYSNERKLNGTVDYGCEEEFNVQITASDSCSDQVGSFKFKKLNNDPIINQTIDDYNVSIGIDFQFQVSEYSFINGELNENFQYEAKLQDNSDLPEWLSFDNQTLIFEGTGPIGCALEYMIRLTAEDSCYFASQLFTLEITNDPPFKNIQLPDQSYRGGDLIYINYPENTFTNQEDPNIEVLNYEAKLSNGDPLPGWLDFYPDEFKFNGSANSCNNTYQIDLIAKDSCYETTNTFNIEINNSPIYLINPIEDKHFSTSDKINFTFPENTFSNADPNEAISYLATLSNGQDLPDWLSFSSDERRFIGTTEEDGCGEDLKIKVQATDTCYTESTEFDLFIENTPPTVNETIPDQNYHVMDEIDYTLSRYTFYNPDENEDLTLQAQLSNGDPLPGWLDFYPSNQTFVGVAPSGCDQQFEIQIIVKDSCYQITENFWLYIENNPIYVNKGIDDYSIGIGEDLNYHFANVFYNYDSNEPLNYTSSLTNGDDFPDWLYFDSDQQLYYGSVPISCSQVFSIRLFVKDTCHLWDTHLDWELNIVNNPPEANTAIEDMEFDILKDFEFYIAHDSFINPEAAIEGLSYEAYLDGGLPLPSWINFDEDERKFSGFHDFGCGEKLNIEIRAIDSCQTSYAQQNFLLSLINNKPEIEQSIDNQVFTANETFEFSFVESNYINVESQETLTYSAIQSNGEDLPDWITFIPEERRFVGQAPIRCSKVYEFFLLVKDSCDNNEITDYFQISVLNTAPEINKEIPDFDVHASNQLLISFDKESFINPDPFEETEYDPRIDGDRLLPDWLHFDDDKFSLLSSTPGGCPDTFNITIYAGDTCYFKEVGQWFLLNKINDPPESNQTIPDKPINVNQDLYYQIPQNSFADDEGFDILKFKANLSNNDPLPSWLHFDEDLGLFNGTVPNGCNETLAINVFAFDTCGLQSATNLFNLMIINTAPTVLYEINDQEIVINENYNYQIPENTFYNAEPNETLNYKVTLLNGGSLPEWLNFDEQTSIISGQPSSQCTETLQIQVQATDYCELNIVNANYDLQITNTVPFVNNIIPDQSIGAEETFNFIFDEETFGNNEDSETLTYAALLENGDSLPDWLSFTPDKRQFEGTTPEDESTYEIKVFASDSCESNTISASFILTVTPENQNRLLMGFSIGLGILAGSLLCCCLGFFLFGRKKSQKEEQDKIDSFDSLESSNNDDGDSDDSPGKLDGAIGSKSSSSISMSNDNDDDDDDSLGNIDGAIGSKSSGSISMSNDNDNGSGSGDNDGDGDFSEGDIELSKIGKIHSSDDLSSNSNISSETNSSNSNKESINSGYSHGSINVEKLTPSNSDVTNEINSSSSDSFNSYDSGKF